MIKKKIFKKCMAMISATAILISGMGGMSGFGQEVKAENKGYGVSNPRRYISYSNYAPVIWDKIKFGSYEQTASFKKTPVKWRILSVNEDKTEALIISDKALDYKQYHEDVVEETTDEYNNVYTTVDYSCTWETSSLRNWLNNEFLNEAFNKEEQAIIKETALNDSESNTTDKVFILSEQDIIGDYGFNYSDWRGNPTNIMKPTFYTAKILAKNIAMILHHGG